MSKYDKSGRRYVDLSFLALSDLPALIDSLASLPDPGNDAFLVWDADGDQLTWRTVPDTQATMYAAYVTGSAGASVAITANAAASTWTVSQIATGRFRVTHNLNLADPKHLAVIPAVTLNAGGTDDRYAHITNENINFFEVVVVDQGAGNVNDNFYFHAVRLV